MSERKYEKLVYQFTPEYNAQVVLEILAGAKSATQACREYQLSDSTISRI